MPGRSRGAKDAAADISRWAVGLAHLQCAVSAARADGGRRSCTDRRGAYAGWARGTGLGRPAVGGENRKICNRRGESKIQLEHRHMCGADLQTGGRWNCFCFLRLRTPHRSFHSAPSTLLRAHTTMSAMYTAESLEAMNYRELQACCKANGQRAAGKVSRTTRGAHCSARLAAPRASLRLCVTRPC